MRPPELCGISGEHDLAALSEVTFDSLLGRDRTDLVDGALELFSKALFGFSAIDPDKLGPADSLRAHAALADFYRAKPDSASQAEAALHLSYADQAAGIRLWCDSMDSFLAAGRYSDCQPSSA